MTDQHDEQPVLRTATTYPAPPPRDPMRPDRRRRLGLWLAVVALTLGVLLVTVRMMH